MFKGGRKERAYVAAAVVALGLFTGDAEQHREITGITSPLVQVVKAEPKAEREEGSSSAINL